MAVSGYGSRLPGVVMGVREGKERWGQGIVGTRLPPLRATRSCLVILRHYDGSAFRISYARTRLAREGQDDRVSYLGSLDDYYDCTGLSRPGRLKDMDTLQGLIGWTER